MSTYVPLYIRLALPDQMVMFSCFIIKNVLLFWIIEFRVFNKLCSQSTQLPMIAPWIMIIINSSFQVGHEPSALTEKRTLDSLYIQPILDTLHRLNPSTPFVQPGEQNGIFDTSSSQTLYLFIDLKTAADETWPAVLSALEPLRSGDWLTTYDGQSLRRNPITVIGTGNTQLSDVQNYLPRDVFFDAPLAQLNSSQYDSLTMYEAPTASTNFAASFGEVRKREMSDTQLQTMREQLDVAHERGIMARYWNQPNYPIGTRNAVWRILWDEGVDLLNVDDLKGAAEFWEGSG